jgi:hypothetical protein
MALVMALVPAGTRPHLINYGITWGYEIFTCGRCQARRGMAVLAPVTFEQV